MPLYDYDCAACGRRFEVIHGVHADGPTACPLCGGAPVRKAFAPPAIHFKGSGWAKKERRAAARSRATPAGDGSGSGEGSTTTATSDSTTGGSASGDPPSSGTGSGTGASKSDD